MRFKRPDGSTISVVSESGIIASEVQTPPLWVGQISQLCLDSRSKTSRRAVERNPHLIMLVSMTFDTDLSAAPGISIFSHGRLKLALGILFTRQVLKAGVKCCGLWWQWVGYFFQNILAIYQSSRIMKTHRCTRGRNVWAKMCPSTNPPFVITLKLE